MMRVAAFCAAAVMVLGALSRTNGAAAPGMAGGTAGAAEQTITAAVSFADTDDARSAALFFDVCRALEEGGISYTWKNAEGNAAQQRQDIAELLQANPAYLAVAPARSLGLDAAIEEAVSAGTKVILLDGSLRSVRGLCLAEVRTDGAGEGALCAEYLCKLFGEDNSRGSSGTEEDGVRAVSGMEADGVRAAVSTEEDGFFRILEIRGGEGKPLNKERGTGFRLGLAACSGIEIAASIEGGGRRSSSKAAVFQYLKEHRGEIDAIFAWTDEDGVGALEALVELGRDGEIPIVSAGGSSEVKEILADGNFAYACVESTPFLGEKLAEVILADAAGEEVESVCVLAGELYTEENAAFLTGY